MGENSRVFILHSTFRPSFFINVIKDITKVFVRKDIRMLGKILQKYWLGKHSNKKDGTKHK